MTTHSAGGELRRNAAPLEPFEHRHQRDGDDQRRGHRQEEFGPGAQRERQADDQADAGDQGQRGKQPVAPDAHLLDGMLDLGGLGNLDAVFVHERQHIRALHGPPF